MSGLKDKKFFKLLESRGFSHIYMSDVSEHLLKNDDIFSHLSKYLVSLPIEQPTIIDINDEHGVICSRIVVTLLTAGHCPGSVMFLIEGENGRVLYTGDFRLPVGGSARLPYLHDETGRLKPLCSLYIDTTFCSEKCMYIPTREQCLVEILRLVEEWLAKGPDYIVRFICPAQYNYEFVFVEIFKKLGEKTHVFESKLKKYKGIKVIEDAVTSVPTEARVHACISGYSNDFKEVLYVNKSPCGYQTEDLKPIKVRLIKPSAMFFQRNSYSDLSTIDHGTNVHRVCFSTHSSLDEIRDMVKYLKPKKVHPNVVGRGTTVEQILHLVGAPYWNYPDSLSPLGCLRNDLNQGESIPSSNSLPFYDDCYKIPHQAQDESSLNREGLLGAVEASNTNILQVNNNTTHYDIKAPIPLTSSNVLANDNTAVKPDCDDTSLVKWECPILSSDDENYDPNCSFDSSKDITDSDVGATSEEQNLPELDEEFPSPVKPQLRKTVPPANHMNTSTEKQTCISRVNSNVLKSEQPFFHIDDSAMKHESTVSSIASKSNLPVKERNLSSGIWFELEKLLASQETSTVCNTNSECKAPLLEHMSINSRNDSDFDTHNRCELFCSIDDSKMIFDSKVQFNRRNTSIPTGNLVSPSHEKLLYSKPENSDKLESRSSAFQSQYKIQILGPDISTNSAESIPKKGCKHSELSHPKEAAGSDKVKSKAHKIQQRNIQMVGEPSWRQSKLILDINELSSNASNPKDVFSQNPKQVMDICYKKLNVLKNDHLKNISNSCLLGDAIAQSNSSLKKIESEGNFLKNSSVPLDVHILDSSRTLSEQHIIKGPQVSHCIAQTDDRNSNAIESTKKRKSPAIKHEFCVEKSQTLSIVSASNNMMTFKKELPIFSKKLFDPFASKYEKSLIKPPKKESATGNSGLIHDDEISILSCRNQCDEVIQLIDLSSDGYDSEVELFNCTELNVEQTLPRQSGKAVKSESPTSVDSVEEEDSPSLLIQTKSKNETAGMTSRIHLDPGRKRKSADKDNFIAKKPPHVDFRSVCDIDNNVESSPEDLLPFTHSQVSTYLNKILGSETK